MENHITVNHKVYSILRLRVPFHRYRMITDTQGSIYIKVIKIKEGEGTLALHPSILLKGFHWLIINPESLYRELISAGLPDWL